MDNLKEIKRKIVLDKTTTHLSGLQEYKECCYSCSHMVVKRKHGWCECKNKTIQHQYTTKCTKNYEPLNLMRCEICGTYVRSLGAHVRHHNLRAAEYKALFGYNRTTGLVCSATKSRLKKQGQEKSELLKSVNYVTNGGKPKIASGIKRRTEGCIHIRQGKQEVSEETRQKMSASRKGKSINKGVPKSEEHKRKLSESHKKRLHLDVVRVIQRDDKGRIVSVHDKYRR